MVNSKTRRKPRSAAGGNTERSRAEEAPERADAELEQRVAERTTELRQAVDALSHEAAERRRAEKALRESEAKWRSLAEHAPDVIATVDRGGIIQFINRTVPGISVEEAIGSSVYDYAPPDQHATIREAYERVFRTGEAVSYESTGLGPDGSTSWYSVRVGPIERDGRVVGATVIATDITERRRAEEEVRKFKTISDNANYGVAMADLAGNLTYVNDYFAGVHGYKPAQLIGKNLSIFHNEKQLEEVIKINQGLQERGSYSALEVWHTHKDGSVFPMLMNGMILKDKDGRPLFMAATAIDITERKRAEEALRESEEQFRLVFENAKDAIFWADPETGLITKCNKAAETLLEKTGDEIIGRHQSALHPPEKAEYYAGVFKRHFEQQGAVDDEAEVITGSGRVIPVHITASVTSVGGKPIIQGIFRDISERRRAEEALRESEAKWRSLAEHAPDFITTVDRDGTIQFINRTVSGMAVEEVIGSGVYDYAPPGQHATMREAYERVLRTGEAVSYESTGLGPDGSTSWYSVRVGPIKQQGQVVALTMIATDITERKRMEEALQRAREELEGKVERQMMGRNPYGLTFREFTVLHHVAAGRADKEIAGELGISPLTVHKHVSNILGKMNAASRTEAGTRALREGLLD